MNNSRPTTVPFLRLNQQLGWQAAPLSARIYEDARLGGLRLGKAGDLELAANEPLGSFAGTSLPRGLAIHPQEGVVLLADPHRHQILFYRPPAVPVTGAVAPQCETDTAYAPFAPLWRAREGRARQGADDDSADACRTHGSFTRTAGADPYTLNQPQDLAFLPNGDLAVVDSGNSRVLVFTWPGLRVRANIDFAPGRPSAIAVGSWREIYVADSARGRIWRLNRNFELDREWAPAQSEVREPVALAFDRHGDLLILDRLGPKVWRLLKTEKLAAVPVFDDPALQQPGALPALQVDGETLVWPRVDALECPPLRLPGVRVDRSGMLPGTRLPLIVLPPEARVPGEGVYYSRSFDLGTPGAQWHRITLALDLPISARVLVSTFTDDRQVGESELPDLPWSAPTVIATEQGLRKPEVLIQSGRGRHLRLRIELLGDGASTPVLHEINLYGPRNSSLRYLPGFFQQDPDSAHFLDRLLSYFDTVQEEVTHTLRDFSRYLDPYGVPAGDFLDWLGRWFQWEFLTEWPHELRREMIAHAVEFYRRRGTAAGIKQILQWHTGLLGEQPQILEHFRLRQYAESGLQTLFVAGRPLPLDISQLAHGFTVVLPTAVVPNDAALARIRQLIDAQKPAHTRYKISLFSPGVRIGKQASIGIDMLLGNFPQAPLGEAQLGRSSTLRGVSGLPHLIRSPDTEGSY